MDCMNFRQRECAQCVRCDVRCGKPVRWWEENSCNIERDISIANYYRLVNTLAQNFKSFAHSFSLIHHLFRRITCVPERSKCVCTRLGWPLYQPTNSCAVKIFCAKMRRIEREKERRDVWKRGTVFNEAKAITFAFDPGTPNRFSLSLP